MASILNLPNGRRAVQFVPPNSVIRKTVRLGKISKEAAADCARSIDALVDARNAGQQAPRKVLEWVNGISDDLAQRLAKLGVIEPRYKPAAVTLGDFLQGYVAKHTDVKSGTATFYGHTKRCLLERFGADKALAEFVPGDADDWRLWLKDSGGHVRGAKGKKRVPLSDNTVRRRCGLARQFFRDAVRHHLMETNPFDGMKDLTVQGNADREHFVTLDVAEAVLAACPDAQWRLIFALSRFGGLRCPSEHLRLRWCDVLWDQDKILVHSPKTERHKDRGKRWVPIFPELRPYLEAVWDEAEEGAEYVITRYRDNTQNLRTQLQRIIDKAGQKQWPKLFQNLRATRATELVRVFPPHKVCKWLGHTEAIAKKHYWQVTDEDYTAAAKIRTTEAGRCKSAANALQQPVTMRPNESYEDEETPGKHGISRVFQGAGMGDGGLEPSTSAL